MRAGWWRPGIPTLAPAGTTGEALYLDAAEKTTLVRAAVEAAAGRAAVVAGIWRSARPRSRISTARPGRRADAVFLTTPIYYPAGDDAVVAFTSLPGPRPLSSMRTTSLSLHGQ